MTTLTTMEVQTKWIETVRKCNPGHWFQDFCHWPQFIQKLPIWSRKRLPQRECKGWSRVKVFYYDIPVGTLVRQNEICKVLEFVATCTPRSVPYHSHSTEHLTPAGPGDWSMRHGSGYLEENTLNQAETFLQTVLEKDFNMKSLVAFGLSLCWLPVLSDSNEGNWESCPLVSSTWLLKCWSKTEIAFFWGNIFDSSVLLHMECSQEKQVHILA